MISVKMELMIPRRPSMESSLVWSVLSDDGSPIDSNTETGAHRTQDNLDDNNYNLTIDLGFKSSDENASQCRKTSVQRFEMETDSLIRPRA